MWISHVASKTLCACRPHYPGWKGQVLRSVAPPPSVGLPLLTGGSAPARDFRGLYRVHVPFGLRTCTLVSPRTSPEASAGRLLASTAPVATGRTDNSPDGTCTRWPSRPRRSLRDSTAHVRPPFVPHCQPRHRRSQAKERRIFLAISQEPRSQLFQGRRWDMASLLPVTTLPGVAWMDDPRSRSFAPHYASQV